MEDCQEVILMVLKYHLQNTNREGDIDLDRDRSTGASETTVIYSGRSLELTHLKESTSPKPLTPIGFTGNAEQGKQLLEVIVT